MKRDSVQLSYPGDCISVNHKFGRRRDGGQYVKQTTKDWMTEFQWLLKHCHLENYKLPLEVTCSGWFKDERSAPDLSNLSNVILNSIEELIGGNDKDYRWHDGTRNIGEKHPYLIITISESLTMPPTMPLERAREGFGASGNEILHKTKKRGLKSHEKKSS